MKGKRLSASASLLGRTALCALALVGSGLALPGCGGSGPDYSSDPESTRRRLMEIKLMWDSPGDVDLHLWKTSGNQCSSKDACSVKGLQYFGDNKNTGPETFNIYEDADLGRYRVGVNLHSLNGVNLSGEWLVYIIVTENPDDPNKKVTSYGAYKLTTPIADGGYPVSVDTVSWWRPFDFDVTVDTDGLKTTSIASSPSTDPLNR